jgi:hypothetical protein
MMGSNLKGNVCQPMKKVPPKKPPRLHIKRYVKKIYTMLKILFVVFNLNQDSLKYAQ